MKCNFHVWQKVVCIASSWSRFTGEGPMPQPVKGTVYTVGEVTAIYGAVFISLVEINDDDGYHSAGFRPVIDRKTDISIFTDMLIGNKQPVDA